MVAFRIVPGGDILKSIDFSTVVFLFDDAHRGQSSPRRILNGMQTILRRLIPWLLPAVIFTCGILSAFFVNDIVCLVMVPFVLTITRRLRLAPVPYLLAVATASNIGSVATITGNPQNMLVGSYSHIPYRTFFGTRSGCDCRAFY
jgi:hypothetical protein